MAVSLLPNKMLPVTVHISVSLRSLEQESWLKSVLVSWAHDEQHLFRLGTSISQGRMWGVSGSL